MLPICPLDRPPAPEEIVGLLADPLRRKLVALLDGVERPAGEMVALTGSNARSVYEQLGRLQSAGIVKSGDDRYVLINDVFARSVREALARPGMSIVSLVTQERNLRCARMALVTHQFWT